MLDVLGLAKTFPLPRGRKNAAAAADPRSGERKFHALRPVTFAANEGEILGVLGPNGAGKTTLLRLLSTALQPSTGTARFDDVDIVRQPRAIRARLGFLSGSTGLYGRLTPREMITYAGRLHGRSDAELEPRIAELARDLDMTKYIDRRNDQLSTGMKQKVSIARTLVHAPDLVILDEPTTGLDVMAAEIIVALVDRLRNEGRTVLLSTHHMHEVERLCDRVIVLREGTLRFSGTIEQMRAETEEQALDRAFLHLMTEEVPDAA